MIRVILVNDNDIPSLSCNNEIILIKSYRYLLLWLLMLILMADLDNERSTS